MRTRLVSALLILALGLLPGAQAVGCPNASAEATHAHAHADHSVGQTSHSHAEGAAHHHAAPRSAPSVEAGSPLEEPSGHSGPACCRGSSQVAASVVWEGVRVRTLDAFPAPPVVVALIAMPPVPGQAARDPRRLRPDERRSPYVRTRAPLLI